MWRRRCGNVAMIALAGMMATTAVGRPGAHAQPDPDEVRGLWVLRTSLTAPERIDELVQTAVRGGYNTLLVQVRGRGDALYASTIDPRSDELRSAPSSFDPLAETIARAHAKGLKVHAWFNVNLVASAAALPAARDHIVNREPGWLMVPRPLAATLLTMDARTPAYLTQLARWSRAESDTVEGVYLSPVPDASQDYTVSVVRDLLSRYPVDGLHLDYIRYPTADFDYSRAALDAFRAQTLPLVTAEERARLDGARASDPLIWTRTFPDGWEAFRRGRLTTLVERIRGAARELRPAALLSAAVVPGAADARTRKLQDWSEWARLDLLDVICPMAYATDVSEFARQVDDAQASAHGLPVWAGIGAWRLPVARTAAHVREARRSAADGILLFSYDSLLTSTAPRGTYFTRLRPAIVDPEQ